MGLLVLIPEGSDQNPYACACWAFVVETMTSGEENLGDRARVKLKKQKHTRSNLVRSQTQQLISLPHYLSNQHHTAQVHENHHQPSCYCHVCSSVLDQPRTPADTSAAQHTPTHANNDNQHSCIQYPPCLKDIRAAHIRI